MRTVGWAAASLVAACALTISPVSVEAGPLQEIVQAGKRKKQNKANAEAAAKAEEARKAEEAKRRAREEQNAAEQKAADLAARRRRRCETAWPSYADPIKLKFDQSLERDLYHLPEVPVTRPWTLQKTYDKTLAEATKMLDQEPNAETQLRTYMDLFYLYEIGTGEARPADCKYWPFDDRRGDQAPPENEKGQTEDEALITPGGYSTKLQLNEKILERLKQLAKQVEVKAAARQAEIEREQKLDEEYEKRLFAAIRRAGAKDDSWYRRLGETIVNYGMKEMRGRAALIDWDDSAFTLIQVLPGGKALFSGDFPFNVMVVGIKTENLMHGTALTDIGVHWVQVLGFVNYTNAMGGQSQAVKVKPLRNIPHPERGEKL